MKTRIHLDYDKYTDMEDAINKAADFIEEVKNKEGVVILDYRESAYLRFDRCKEIRIPIVRGNREYEQEVLELRSKLMKLDEQIAFEKNRYKDNSKEKSNVMDKSEDEALMEVKSLKGCLALTIMFLFALYGTGSLLWQLYNAVH